MDGSSVDDSLTARLFAKGLHHCLFPPAEHQYFDSSVPSTITVHLFIAATVVGINWYLFVASGGIF